MTPPTERGKSRQVFGKENNEISLGHIRLLQDTRTSSQSRPVDYKEHPKTVTRVQLRGSFDALELGGCSHGKDCEKRTKDRPTSTTPLVQSHRTLTFP